MLIFVKIKNNYFWNFFDILFELFKILPCTLTIKVKGLIFVTLSEIFRKVFKHSIFLIKKKFQLFCDAVFLLIACRPPVIAAWPPFILPWSSTISLLRSAIISIKKSNDASSPFCPGIPDSPLGPWGPFSPGAPGAPTGPRVHLQKFSFNRVYQSISLFKPFFSFLKI